MIALIFFALALVIPLLLGRTLALGRPEWKRGRVAAWSAAPIPALTALGVIAVTIITSTGVDGLVVGLFGSIPGLLLALGIYLVGYAIAFVTAYLVRRNRRLGEPTLTDVFR